MTPVDTVALAQALVRRPSVTPADAGAMDVLQAVLEPLGFRCRRLRFGEVENLYARWGAATPHLCFLGHTDVVPVGDAAAWRHPPFGAEVADGVLYGRGVADMKGALAAFAAAAAGALADGVVAGSLSLLVTGDEEGPGLDGARRVVERLREEGERIDHGLVGEPTSAAALGDMIKVGRRGSLNAVVTVRGTQGHAAYPERAANPVPVLVALLHRLARYKLDEGYPEFQPSNLEVTDLEVGNPAHNVIPAKARARLNVRFNPCWTGERLAAWLETEARGAESGFAGRVEVEVHVPGEPFYTPPDAFTDVVAAAVQEAVGRRPGLSTSGGASDARFLRALCPVVELGLVGATMHAVDEQAPVTDLEALARIYAAVLRRYYEAFRAAA